MKFENRIWKFGQIFVALTICIGASWICSMCDKKHEKEEDAEERPVSDKGSLIGDKHATDRMWRETNQEEEEKKKK